MKIEIIILGLLLEGNLYGYEIKKKIEEQLEDYVDIKFGSIYYAIKKAVDNEWINRIGTEKESNNPERYVYEILPAGKKHYKKLLKQYFDSTFIHFNIDIILMFFNSLQKEQKESFIEERMAFINEKIKAMKDKMKGEAVKNSEHSRKQLFTYLLSHLEAELSWLKSESEQLAKSKKESAKES